jgi:hypothetical protein
MKQVDDTVTNLSSDIKLNHTTTATEMITVISKAVTTMFNKDGAFYAQWHMITADDQIIIIPQITINDAILQEYGDVAEPRHRAVSHVIVKQMFEQFNAVSYCMVDNGWTIDSTTHKLTSEDVDFLTEHGIEKFPHKQRAIIYVSEDKDGIVTARQTVTTPNDASSSKLGPIEFVSIEKAVHVNAKFGLLPKRTNESRSKH